jgi:2-oxoglutarate ferredoxin oxidoreductase subunit beta
VDIFQPCVSFNKINTFQWFKEHIYELEETYDPCDRNAAVAKAYENEKFPVGIIYLSPKKLSFEENVGLYGENKTPLSLRSQDRRRKLSEIILSKKEGI